jgi:uroporphyrinogen decarboxylase
MNARQRVLDCLNFQPVDRPPFDLMEGCVWAELLEFFRSTLNLQDPKQVIDFLDPDFRWGFSGFLPDPAAPAPAPDLDEGRASKIVATGPLAAAQTPADTASYAYPNPDLWRTADFRALRQEYPEKALVFCPGWMPVFWSACEAFGVEAALVNMISNPGVFEAFTRRYQESVVEILQQGCRQAADWCDLALLGDDFASQQGLLISPALWRKWVKPHLAEQVRILRENRMLVLFHSCGSVRPILPDLIEIGVNALLVFQTTARGMDARSIARDFGGRLAFYGGIDVQQILSYGTPAQVSAEVKANQAAFSECGGYIIANSHHTIPSIKGENILAMCTTARGLD